MRNFVLRVRDVFLVVLLEALMVAKACHDGVRWGEG